MAIQQWAPVWRAVPMRFRLSSLSCIFDTNEDGNSFKAMVGRARHITPMILVVRTTEGYTLGAYITATW